MHCAKRSLISALSVLFLLQPAGASAQSSVSKEEFYAALIEGYQDAWGKTSETERQTTQPNIQELSPNERVPLTGGWQLTIVHACPLDGFDNSTSNNYGKVMTYTNLAYILNQSDRMEFLLESQDVNTAVIDGVDSALDKRRNELSGEFSDVQVALTKQDNGKFGLVATFPYASGVSRAALRSRIDYFLSASGFTMCDIFTASERLSWEHFKTLASSDIQIPLAKAEFLSLYPLFREPGYETESNGPEGNWALRGDDDGNYGQMVENWGDGMKLWVRVPIARATGLETLGAESAATIEQEVTNQIKPWKQAQSVEVGWGGNNLWVGFVYSYAGMKGKDVANLLEDFIDQDGGEDTYKDVRKIMKKHGAP